MIYKLVSVPVPHYQLCRLFTFQLHIQPAHLLFFSPSQPFLIQYGYQKLEERFQSFIRAPFGYR